VGLTSIDVRDLNLAGILDDGVEGAGIFLLIFWIGEEVSELLEASGDQFFSDTLVHISELEELGDLKAFKHTVET